MSDTSGRDEEGKRFPLNMRTTRDLREKIERAAKHSGRSMSQEVEYRVERSFADENIANATAINAVNQAFDTILGTGEAKKLLMAYATAIKMIEIQTGKPFQNDEFTKIVMSQTMWLIFRAWYGPVSDDKFSTSEQKEIMSLTEKMASFACGIIDLQGQGKLHKFLGKLPTA